MSKLGWMSGILLSIAGIWKLAEWKWIEFETKYRKSSQLKIETKKKFQANQKNSQDAMESSLNALIKSLEAECNMISVLKSNLSLNAASRLDRWEDVKITSFTRLIALVYVTILQSIITKTLIHILGRWIHLNSSFGGDRITEEMYLSFSWYFCNIGWKDFVFHVQNIVKKELSSVSLKHDMTFDDIKQTIKGIRDEIHNQIKDFSIFLLPKEGEENEFLVKYQETLETDQLELNSDLTKLLNETRDYLESPDFPLVLVSMLDHGFTFIESKLSLSFSEKTKSDSGSLALASIIPLVTRIFTDSIFPGLCESVNSDPMLLSFCMIIYAPTF